MRAAAWIVGVGAAALAFAAGRWTSGDPQSASPASPSASREAPLPPSPSAPSVPGECPRAEGLKLLERCSRQLAAAQTRRAAARADRDVDADASTSEHTLATCLERPDVIDECRNRFSADGSRDEPETGRASAASTAGPDFARRFATDVVGTSEAEAEWVEDYLCSVHRVRETMIDDLDDLLERGADASELDEVITRARSDRKAVLADLEQRLGDDRYARLRAVGGLSVLGSALDCPPA